MIAAGHRDRAPLDAVPKVKPPLDEPCVRMKPPVPLEALKTKAPADCGPSSVTEMVLLPVAANVTVPLLGTVLDDPVVGRRPSR